MTRSQQPSVVGHRLADVRTVALERGDLHCMVVAAESSRRQALFEAAKGSGWKTFSCSDAAAATSRVRQIITTLVVLDLTTATPAEFRALCELAETMSRQTNVLLMICGQEGNFQQEIWARQLGAWLYLTGNIEPTGLTVLCGEARQIAERLLQDAATN